MKRLFLLLISCQTFYSHAQLSKLLQRRNDTALQKQIKKMALSDNQFIDAENKDFITLFNIIPEKALANKDSLLKESREKYKNIVASLGKRWENENIDISYRGKETDKNNYNFSYSHNIYNGEATYNYRQDTLLASDINVRQRLTKLGYNKYVRHELDNEGLSIIFNVILKDGSIMTQKLAEENALNFFLQYMRGQYCLYNSISIIYIDQYSGGKNLFKVKVEELIVNNHVDYYNNKRRAALQP